MSKLRLFSTSRDEFVEIARRVGERLRSTHTQYPWLVTVSGDFRSGKSLIALAIEAAFNPDEFPNGKVPKTKNIKHACGAFRNNSPVVFRNFRNRLKSYREKIYVELENEISDVIVISNASAVQRNTLRTQQRDRTGSERHLHFNIRAILSETGLTAKLLMAGQFSDIAPLRERFEQAAASLEDGQNTESLFWRKIEISGNSFEGIEENLEVLQHS